MKIFIILSYFFIITPTYLTAQEEKPETLPYHQIPDFGDQYTVQTVLARMIDGLGYRYYWATHELREADLMFTPGNDGRIVKETLHHIFLLTNTIMNAIKGQPIILPNTFREYTWDEKRKATLENIKAASDFLKSNGPPSPEDMKMIFQRGDKTSEYPLWNLLNGPLADAIYHTGQIVSHRRSAGNPLHPGVSVFIGKTKE